MSGFDASPASPHLEPSRSGRVGGDRRHTNGVADDPDPPTRGQRLALEELGRVEQLIAAAEPEQSRLMQKGIGGLVAAQRRRGVGASLGEDPCGDPSTLDGKYGLVP